MPESFGNLGYGMLKDSVMSAGMAMAITDPHQPDNPIVFSNPAFSAMTGYEASEVVGRNCRFLQGKNTDPATVAAIHKALVSAQEIQIDILNYRRDGTEFTNRLYISPVFDARGALIHFFACQLDATEQNRKEAIRRRTEGVLRYLAAELNQRLNLTIRTVQTLVSTTLASASSVLEASESISARLVALGHVHSSLLESDWEDRDLEELVRQTTAPFHHDTSGVRMAGPSVRVGALFGLKLSSAIYELCAEAAGHAEADRQPRDILVEWRLVDQPGGPRLQFDWRQRNACRAGNDARKKLHRKLLVILSNLQAEVSLRDDEKVRQCRIEAPLQ